LSDRRGTWISGDLASAPLLKRILKGKNLPRASRV
jgi:hypothetical protein